MFSVSNRAATSLVLTATGLALATLSCTDSGLEPARGDAGQVFDDELRLTGEVCLSPDTDAVFPVKVLFVVDTSDSMSVTDRSGNRAKAVRTVLQRYQDNPAVLFGVIAFDSRVERLTQGFTNAPDLAAIDTRISQADRLTDYQGALGGAYQMISEDIVASSPAERARSKYIIIFFSDGTPDPQCSASATPCGASECPAHQHCRATVCKDDYLVCTVPRKDWSTAFSPPIPVDMYPDLGEGADYNLSTQILRAVDDILGLQDFYRVGEIRLHTAFLYDPEAAADPLAVPFGLDRDGGVALMTAMAESGLGTFTEFDSASKIDFLSINYTPYIEENGLAGVLATNLSVIDTGDGLEPDSDGDGLTDAQERVLHTCVAAGPGCIDPADSDGDGYTDLFEERNRVSGFDPLDPNKPFTPCAPSDRGDLDGDLLRDCEEAFLKTDPRLPDSDGDRIPDGVEFRAGMNPLDRTDAFGDLDNDKVRNLDEVTAHTNPTVASPPGYQPVRYLYDVAPFTKVTGERCYHLDVRHIKLLTTGKGTNATSGVNRVLVYFDEAPVGRVLDYGNIRVACADVRFVDGAVKSPSDGVVPLIERCTQVPVCPPPPPCMDFKPAGSFVQLPFSAPQWSAGDCKNLTSICPHPPDAGGP
jgi:uncharacterized protein YegL